MTLHKEKDYGQFCRKVGNPCGLHSSLGGQAWIGETCDGLAMVKFSPLCERESMMPIGGKGVMCR